MPYVDCIDCGDEFWQEDDEEWKVRCYHCWKAKKQNSYGSSKSPLQTLKDENWLLRQEIEKYRRLDEDISMLFQFYKFLIFACHPDRVPGREQEAHEVLIWLNSHRENFS